MLSMAEKINFPIKMCFKSTLIIFISINSVNVLLQNCKINQGLKLQQTSKSAIIHGFKNLFYRIRIPDRHLLFL